MNKYNKSILFVNILVIVILIIFTLLKTFLKNIVPTKNPYGKHIGGILDFPQPFVRARVGRLTGAGTLCSKESCLTKECRQEWEKDKNSFKVRDKGGEISSIDEGTCKMYYYTRMIIGVSILIPLITMHLYILYTISKGKLNLFITIYISIISILILLTTAIAEMGQPRKTILSHIQRYWSLYINPLFLVYIIIYYIYSVFTN